MLLPHLSILHIAYWVFHQQSTDGSTLLHHLSTAESMLLHQLSTDDSTLHHHISTADSTLLHQLSTNDST